MDGNVVRIPHDAFKKGMDDPAFRATLARLNEDAFYLGTGAYRDFVIERIAEWKRVIEEVGARSE